MDTTFIPVSLVIVPAIAAFLLLIFRGSKAKNFIVISASALIALGSLVLFFLNNMEGLIRFKLDIPGVSAGMLGIEIFMALFIIFIALRNGKSLVALLALIQVCLLTGFELRYGHALIVANDVFIDTFSVIMALIIGVIGTLIAVYSLGYMRSFHRLHAGEFPDRQPMFFFIIFVFLAAMFGIVFSNNLLWLYFFWEITTLSSFLLIGYKGNAESAQNAFRALLYNLIGGLFFAVAIVWMHFFAGTIEMDKLMVMHKAVVMFPVMLLCFAGLTKSAQLPFSSWLVGAMVAPSPVSALLHSSTMVKAGVYLIVRFAGVLEGTVVGLMIALVGGITFLLTTFIAVSQSDAKKVLAYSTIANLGLIVMCAGIGTYQAVWAAILLIIFHAVAKGLLFLCVGVIEHKLHSRDIEDMTGLIIKMPKMSIMLQVGMAGMFLAPFGMLISKWAVLRALVDYNPLLTIFLVFGSSATLFFWVKWMGQLLCVLKEEEDDETGISRAEWMPLTTLTIFTVGVCAFFPLIAKTMIEPFIRQMYNATVTMGQGNIMIMLIMLAMVMLFPLSFFYYGKKVKVVDAYLSGANTAIGTSFTNSLGGATPMEMKNYYLKRYFQEEKLLRIGVAVCIFLMCAATFIFVS
ncbi:MAG: NADH-quinone oxidoreductase subunit L [Candidatus Omnitrophica bacterium]|nr:NADH-quinone oxidoreductase subunit L [Candidatus Omnitrophota bacterium]